MRSRPRHIAALLGTSTCAVFVSVATAPAARAASLLLGPGTYTANTATLHLTGPSTDVTGKNVGGIAVFRFSTVNVPDGATILATGSRPFELAATNSLIVGGIIDGSGATATRGEGAAPPGPGGGAGGERTSFTSSTPGSGPGGGAAGSNGENGGAGGGFGGAGARGAVCLDPGCTGGTAATGGARYGNPDTTLQGGSGGGPGWTDALGGGGGGAIALVGASVTITTTAVVIANGGDGDSGAPAHPVAGRAARSSSTARACSSMASYGPRAGSVERAPAAAMAVAGAAGASLSSSGRSARGTDH